MGVGAEANSDHPSLRFIGGVLHLHIGWGNTPGLGPLQMNQGWHAACDIPLTPISDLTTIMQTVSDIDAGMAPVSEIDVVLSQSPGAATAWAAASQKAATTCGQAALNTSAYRALRRLLY